MPDLARWGGLSISSGAVAVINDAQFKYGGGSINTGTGTLVQRDVITFTEPTNFAGQFGLTQFGQPVVTPLGTRAFITNNTFIGNSQAAMSIDPDGLLAADPLRPLMSGNPFFRGNIFLANDLNGLEVLPDSTLSLQPGYTANLYVDSVWDSTDLTYILRNPIILAGADPGFTALSLPTPGTTFTTEQTPSITLTLQSSLPGTLLANGQTIPEPGESLIVKEINKNPTVGNATTGQTGLTSNGSGLDTSGGASFFVGVDNITDPPADTLVDAGYFSEFRILGIGANQTTGQQRVPVVITSLYDNTEGRTVRGVAQFDASANLTQVPQAGDGGVIDFGALSESDYNLYRPPRRQPDRQRRHQVHHPHRAAGRRVGLSGQRIRPGSQARHQPRHPAQHLQGDDGLQLELLQLQPGRLDRPPVRRHPARRDRHGAGPARHGPPGPAHAHLFRERHVREHPHRRPHQLADARQHLRHLAQRGGLPQQHLLQRPHRRVPPGAGFDGANDLAHNHVLFMDNIFDGSTTGSVIVNGQAEGYLGEYNLYFNDPTFTSGGVTTYVNFTGAVIYREPDILSNIPTYDGDFQAVVGNPMFTDAAAGDFSLQPGSAAIDEARSELGPSTFGLALQPIVDEPIPPASPIPSIGIRNDTGRNSYFGGVLFQPPIPLSGTDIVSLPGSPLREQQFQDEWYPAIPGSPGAIGGPTSNAGNVFSYIYTTGQRDQDGNLRVKDPNSPNVGFGSEPFFDIGAYEYVILNPPKITGVTATELSSTGAVTTVPFYNAGMNVGANQTPLSIVLQFNQRLEPATVNSMTILLEVAGLNGIFDPSTDKFINLSGKLAYDPTTETVSINLATSGLSLNTDTYRLIVYGSGSNVIRNLQGEALDGENTSPLTSDQPDNPTLPLPTGDGRPGGNFYLTFTIDTNSPSIVPGTFALAPGSDTGIVGDNITDDNRPDFVGQITDVPPPANPLLGDTVEIDVSTKGDGVFDMLDVASGLTNAAGFFTATYNPNSPALPDSVVTIGPSGILGNPDNTGFSVFRVRVINSAGNQSSVTDPNAQLGADIDTTPPRVLAVSPVNNSDATQTSGVIPVSIVVNENLLPASLTASSIQVVRTAGSGGFGAGASPVSIDPASLTIQNLPSATGEEVIHFNIIGATATDVYQVTLDGTGANAVTDVAGNDLDGTFNGSFPTGSGTPGEAGNFVFQFIVYNPTSGAHPLREQRRGALGGPHRHHREPVPDDHRRAHRLAARRHRGRPPRRLYREHHPQVAGQGPLGLGLQHRHPVPPGHRAEHHHPRPGQRRPAHHHRHRDRPDQHPRPDDRDRRVQHRQPPQRKLGQRADRRGLDGRPAHAVRRPGRSRLHPRLLHRRGRRDRHRPGHRRDLPERRVRGQLHRPAHQ